MSAPVFEPRRPPLGRLAGFALLLAAVSWGLGAFSAFPWGASDPTAALVRVAVKHVAAFEHEAQARSTEEIQKLPRHMRPQSAERARTGRRVDSVLSLSVDGQPLLRKSYSPGGLRGDGPTFSYEEVPLLPGRHRIEVVLADGRTERAGERPRSFTLDREVDVRPGQALLVEFTEDAGLTLR